MEMLVRRQAPPAAKRDDDTQSSNESTPKVHGLKKNWLLVGLVVAILVARWHPDIGASNGPLRPEITVKYGAVGLIFFLSGLSLQPRQLTAAVSNARLHLFVQGFTFCVVPVWASVVLPLLRPHMNQWLVDGLMAVACMPPPVSSAVILTKSAGGNDAAAIFNAALGSCLGVVVTPLLLVYFLSAKQGTGARDLASVFVELGVTVLLPLVLGQLFRPCLVVPKATSSTVSQLALLLIIYTTFCDSFVQSSASSVSIGSVLSAAAVVISSLVLLTSAVFTLARRIGLPPPDVVCALFSATHKSLTLGIPVMRLVFSQHAGFSTLTMPLLIYHPAQILLGGMLVPAVKDWLDPNIPTERRRRRRRRRREDDEGDDETPRSLVVTIDV